MNQMPKKNIEIIENDAFSYDGYQVVHGEFFSHTCEPSFTFNNYRVSEILPILIMCRYW